MDGTVEKKRGELAAGDVIVAKQGGKRYTVRQTAPGVGGKHFPYLILEDERGNKVEHDTSFDSVSATYTVVTEGTNHGRDEG